MARDSGGTPGGEYTPTELMIVAAASALRDNAVCFVGIGLPSAAANLARRLHAPNLVLVYESGTIGAKPSVLPLSIGDGVLAETADTIVSMAELFHYWLQAGRIDVGFLGAAQLDRFGNINTTVIGPYERPKVRLPGAGGAPAIADYCREVYVIIKHTPRHLVSKLDFLTTLGYGDGSLRREELGLPGRGPTKVITDLGILEPDPATQVLTLTHVHPGVDVDAVRAATGWELAVATDLATTPPPTSEQLAVLRKLAGRDDGG